MSFLLDLSPLELAGWIGMLLIVSSWLPQTYESFKSKQCHVNIYFLILSFVGSSLLTVYALLRVDLPFVILNGLVCISTALNMYIKVLDNTDYSAKKKTIKEAP